MAGRAFAGGLTVLLVGLLAVHAPGRLYLELEYAKALWAALAVGAAWIVALVLAGPGGQGGHGGHGGHGGQGDRLRLPLPLVLAGLGAAWLAGVSAALEPGHPSYDGTWLATRQAFVWGLAVGVASFATPAGVARFLRWLGLALLGVAALTVTGRLLHWDRSGLVFSGADLSLSMGSSNTLACFLVMALPLVLAGWLAERERAHRLLLGAAAVAVACGIAATGSRNGLASGAAVAVLVLLPCLLRVRGTRWPGAALRVAGAAAAVFALGALLNPAETDHTLGSLGQAAAADAGVLDPGRRHVYRVALALVGESPATLLRGHGAGSFFPLANAFPAPAASADAGRTMVVYAHSELLETLVESGVVGLALLLASTGWLAAGLLRAGLSRERDEAERIAAFGVLAGLAGFLGFGLVSVAPRYVANQVLFAILLGLAARIGAREGGPPEPRPRVRWGAVPLLLLAVAFALVTGPKLWSNRVLDRALELGAAEAEQRAALVARAVEIDPESVEARHAALRVAIEAGDLEGARRDFAELQARVPFFLDVHAEQARFLASQGKAEEALELLHAYLAVHRYDTVVRVQAAAIAVLTGDMEQVSTELAELLVTTVERAARRHGLAHRARIVEDGEGGAVEIERPDGETRSVSWEHLPWLLLRESPHTLDEAQRRIVTNLRDFFREHLGIASAQVLHELEVVFLEGRPRRW